MDEESRAKNRRVEILFFDGPVDPQPGACGPPKGRSQHKRWTDRVAEEIDLAKTP